jgi:uncharacterized membrane protein
MMESRAKLAGHAIHPMLVVFPLGLLATAFVFDLVHLYTGAGHWAMISYWLIAAGIIGGLAAAPFGTIDWMAIPAGTRAKSVGLTHGLGNVVVLAFFAASWYLRRGHVVDPGTVPIVLAGIGVALSLATAWLGGELVERLGIGVDSGANADAPSSLSGRPASDVSDSEEPLRRAS